MDQSSSTRTTPNTLEPEATVDPGSICTSTIEEFAAKLEDLYQRGKAIEPKTIKAGCALPFHLQGEAGKVADLLPHYHIKCKQSELEFYFEISRGK